MSAVAVPGAHRRAAPRIDRLRIMRVLGSVTLVLLAAVYVLPLVWLVSISVRVQSDVFRSMLIPASFEPSNYVAAWDRFELDVVPSPRSGVTHLLFWRR